MQMLLHCTIPKENIKIFIKAITYLSKISEDITFEINPEENSTSCLFLKAMNPSNSIYSVVTFSKDFFSNFSVKNDKYKIPILSKILTNRVFKTTTNTSTIEIVLYDQSDKKQVNFILTGNHFLSKTYSINFTDENTLEANYDRSVYQIHIDSKPEMMNKMLENFHNDVTEIMFCLNENTFSINSVFEDNTSKAILNTHLSVPCNAFDFYENLEGQNADMIFDIKPLKGFLNFTETSKSNVEYFMSNVPGLPILFSTTGTNQKEVIEFQCDLLIAARGNTDPKVEEKKTTITDTGSPKISYSDHTSPLPEKRKTPTNPSMVDDYQVSNSPSPKKKKDEK
jgi:hypothetical protein